MTNAAIGLNNYATGENSRFPELWRGCVGAWAMCLGPTGTRLFDFSGRQNWGTLSNMDAATDWVVSGGQYALDFDGVDDVVRLPFSIEMPFTVSGWFSSRSTTATQYALSICSSISNAPHYSLIFDGNAVGDLIYAAHEGDATAFQGSSFTGYVANQMYHLTGVFRSSTNRQLYVNANAQAVNTTSVGTTTINRLAIGRFDRLSPAVPFDGVADDIRVYNRALTEPVIRLLASKRGIAYERRSRRRVNEQAAAAALNAIYATRQTQLIGGGLL